MFGLWVSSYFLVCVQISARSLRCLVQVPSFSPTSPMEDAQTPPAKQRKYQDCAFEEALDVELLADFPSLWPFSRELPETKTCALCGATTQDRSQ